MSRNDESLSVQVYQTFSTCWPTASLMEHTEPYMMKYISLVCRADRGWISMHHCACYHRCSHVSITQSHTVTVNRRLPALNPRKLCPNWIQMSSAFVCLITVPLCCKRHFVLFCWRLSVTNFSVWSKCCQKCCLQRLKYGQAGPYGTLGGWGHKTREFYSFKRCCLKTG